MAYNSESDNEVGDQKKSFRSTDSKSLGDVTVNSDSKSDKKCETVEHSSTCKYEHDDFY